MKHLNSFKTREFSVLLGVAGAVILVFATLSPANASFRSSGLQALRSGPLDVAPATGTSVRSEHEQTIDGQPWSLTAFTNSQSQVCAGELVPNDAGDGGQALTCREPQTMFAKSPVVAFFGARVTPKTLGTGWSNSWVWGWVSSAVSTVELQLTDCSTVSLPVTSDHTFFIVFSSEQLAAGVGAQSLTTLDSEGRTIGSVDVAVAPPVDAQGDSQGSAPPRANC